MRTAVVTGAASGIGRALASRLSAEGYRVHLADVAPVETLARELGGVPFAADVTNPADMEALAEAAADADVVCLNAGVVGPTLGSPWDVDPEEWRALVGVNLLGVVNGLRAFVPRLLATGQQKHLIITGSLAGLVTFPGGGAYAATKHALVAVAEQTAMHLRATPVEVTLLCPALVRTGMSEAGEDPDQVAQEALTAAREHRFLVVPRPWSEALTRRTEMLMAGDVPATPLPEGSTP